MKESKYYKKKLKKQKELNVSNSIWLSKLLLSIIILLVVMIFSSFRINYKDDALKFLLEDNLKFYKMNEIYRKYVGDENKKNEETIAVNSTSNLLYLDEIDGSYKIQVENGEPINFYKSGIIVFVGNKDDLGDTVIVQGNDGVDIWYSNVTLDGYSLYDYVKAGDILGRSVDCDMIVTIMKDGKKVIYEEYFK